MTDLQQATVVKWGSAGAGAVVGAYAGFKIAGKYSKNKPVGAVIGALALGAAVFTAVHLGTKTEVPAGGSSGADGWSINSGVRTVDTSVVLPTHDNYITQEACKGRGGKVVPSQNAPLGWYCTGGLNTR